MLQRYGPAFAKVYNEYWNGFSLSLAPRLFALAEERVTSGKPGGSPAGKRLLDLCCGTGQLSGHFLERGWKATGVDLSRDMLAIADARLAEWGARGSWFALQADARSFSLPDQCDFAVSLYDALNHLSSEEDLASCFSRVSASLCEGGSFVFDLNTRLGLRNWNTLDVEDREDVYLVKRGLFVEEESRAWLDITGFSRQPSGSWERFHETFYNTAFRLERVVGLLKSAGFGDIELRKGRELLPIADEPEGEARVFFLARLGDRRT